MKYAASLIAYIAALHLAPHYAMAAQTDAGTCYAIADSDARAVCLALAHRDPGRCYVVKRQEIRAMCLAEVRR